MHIAKLAFLLLLTLAVMRIASWLIGWATYRLAGVSRIASALVGNAVALALFVGLLMWDRLPGEPVDGNAIIFGVVVFGVCQVIDLKWVPWVRSQSRQRQA